MQKSMFLNKKLDTAHHLLKLGTGVIKGVVNGSEKHQTSEFSLLVECLCILKIANFEIFWKIHKCAS